MENLNLPEYSFKIKKTEKGFSIFDKIRKKYVNLTPEEWVRQNIIEHLTTSLGYPQARFANEILVKVNGMPKRCDSIFYDLNKSPYIIIEYKAPSIEITQEVFDQIASYNTILNVNYLLVSNGITHYFCKIDYEHHKYIFFKDIPSYEELFTR